MCLDLRGNVVSFCRGILRLSSIYSTVLSNMMVFQTFVGVHEELVYFICSRTRSPRLWDVNSKIHMSEPESGKGKVNTVYFFNQARGKTRINRTAKFVYKE